MRRTSSIAGAKTATTTRRSRQWVAAIHAQTKAAKGNIRADVSTISPSPVLATATCHTRRLRHQASSNRIAAAQKKLMTTVSCSDGP